MSSSSIASSHRAASWAVRDRAGAPIAAAASDAVGRLQAAWAVWSARTRRRRDALALDRLTLSDIGLNRGLVILEAAKPFWRA